MKERSLGQAWELFTKGKKGGRGGRVKFLKTWQMKFCPTTSVDVERSFSVFKNIISNHRQSFIEENLSKTVASHCF